MFQHTNKIINTGLVRKINGHDKYIKLLTNKLIIYLR
jgi:hypothetical protein